MNTHNLTHFLATLAAAALVFGLGVPVNPARAATPVAAAAPAPASAPVGSKSTPRPMTPAQKSQAATVPGDVRPEEPVVPQISIPLGRTPPAPLATSSAAQRKRAAAAASGGIDDSIARCKAMETKGERDDCLARQRRVGK
jgi:hypothetical protein